jgi:DNA-binding winged helix-turn-helix (wHTH) protein
VANAPSQLRVVRFGAFEADLQTGELRKAGVKLKFSGQPFQVLAILLERPGDVVTREELQKRLWPDTFVDVERNLNTAINKIREVLSDSAESPQFVETLPRRGYRFIAPVAQERFPSNQVSEKPPPVEEPSPPPKSKFWKRSVYHGPVLLGVVLVTAALLAFWRTATRTPRAPRVLGFKKLTNDGQAKAGRMATDGSRLYFNEILSNGQNVIVQVSTKGGDSAFLPVSVRQPKLLDLSKDGAELLVADYQGYGQPHALWVQPVAGGSPRRIGTVLAVDAAFGPNETSIIFSDEHDVYSISRDGSVQHKVLTVPSVPFGFRFSPDGRVFRFSHLEESTSTTTLMQARSDGTGLRKCLWDAAANGLQTGGYSSSKERSTTDSISGSCRKTGIAA